MIITLTATIMIATIIGTTMAGEKRRSSEIPAALPVDPPLSAAALYRLATWLSPAFPVGAFAYSSGIEWAVESGDICDAATLGDWLRVLLSDGAGSSDAIFFALAYRAVVDDDDAALKPIAELAAAFAPTRERHLETTTQGQAFMAAVRAAWPCAVLDRFASIWSGPIAYPVVVAVTCAGHGVPLSPALHAFLAALTANWVSAGVRIIPLGQTDSQRVIHGLEPDVQAVARRALQATVDDLGGCAFRADLGSIHHETQYTRLFRS
ncbi:MAG: urease accessory protein UreF [Pseudolabrys sp.]